MSAPKRIVRGDRVPSEKGISVSRTFTPWTLAALSLLASLAATGAASAQGYYPAGYYPYPQSYAPFGYAPQGYAPQGYAQPYLYPAGYYPAPQYAPVPQPPAQQSPGIEQTGLRHAQRQTASAPGQPCADCGCSGPFGCHHLIDGYRYNQLKAKIAGMHDRISSHLTMPSLHAGQLGQNLKSHLHKGPIALDNFPVHPYAHGPRDFFMFYENLEAERARDLRPAIVP